MTRRFDLALLLAFLLPLVAILPLVQHAGVPNVADGVIHVLRQVDFDRDIRSGLLVPRWGADFYLGFGYPLYNFAPPLLAYAVEAIHLLGAALDDSLKVIVIATLELYSVGMFLFMRPKVGAPGALAAAALNVYAPMRMREALVTGGNYPQFLALALFPLVLWAFDGIIRTQARRYLVIAALIYAALALSHIFHAMIFTPVAAGYVLIRLIQTRAARAVWVMAFGAALLALLISTFFWLPTIAERSLTHTAPEQYIATSDFHQRFLSWDRLLAPPALLDDGEVNADVPLALGWVQLAAGALGLMVVGSGVVRAGRLTAVPDAVFWLLVLGASVFLQLPASTFIWDNVPLLPVAEFPWRFMGISAFALAVLGGYALPARDDDGVQRRNAMTTEVVTTYMFGSSDGSGRRRRGQLTTEVVTTIVAAFLVGAAIVSAFPYTIAPRGFIRLGTPSIQNVLQYEQSTGAYGLTTINEYLPQTVQQLPSDAPAPLGRAKIDRPASAVLEARWTPRGESDRINLAQSGPVRFRIFYYPGWTVTLDGKPVPTATQKDGTFTVQAPAGEHQIETRFEETPVRMASNIVSGLSLLVLLPLLLMPLPQNRRWHPVWAPAERAEPAPDGGVGWIAVIMLLVFIAKFAVVDPRGLLHETRFTQPLAVFDGQVAVMAGESDQSAIGRGSTLHAWVYWEPLLALTKNYHVIAQLIGADGSAIAGSDKQHPGDPVVQGETPTTQIPSGRYLRDEHNIVIPANAPPGKYELRVGLYDPATGKRLKLTDGGTLFAVGEVEVR